MNIYLDLSLIIAALVMHTKSLNVRAAALWCMGGVLMSIWLAGDILRATDVISTSLPVYIVVCASLLFAFMVAGTTFAIFFVVRMAVIMARYLMVCRWAAKRGITVRQDDVARWSRQYRYRTITAMVRIDSL